MSEHYLENYFLVGIQRACVGGHGGRRRKKGRTAGGAHNDGFERQPF